MVDTSDRGIRCLRENWPTLRAAIHKKPTDGHAPSHNDCTNSGKLVLYSRIPFLICKRLQAGKRSPYPSGLHCRVYPSFVLSPGIPRGLPTAIGGGDRWGIFKTFVLNIPDIPTRPNALVFRGRTRLIVRDNVRRDRATRAESPLKSEPPTSPHF